jgi:hypothetical protein
VNHGFGGRAGWVARVALVTMVVACPWAGTAQANLPAASFVFDGPVNAVVSTADGVYVGGSFTRERAATGGGLIVDRAGSGAPDPSTFPQVGGEVTAVTSDGAGGWFIGGVFSRVGGVVRNNVAHILGSGVVDPSWHPDVDGGLISRLAVNGSLLYVGGGFGEVDGETRRGLAAISTSSGQVTGWDPAGASGGGSVYALAVSGGTVYVGGDFASMGGQARDDLAAVDASTGVATAWDPSPTGGGFSYHVLSLAISGSTVYVGGDFTSIGGQPRSSIAAIDATSGVPNSWNPNATGGSADSAVSELVVGSGVVYAGGDFTNIGGQARTRLAALDASTGNATAFDCHLGVGVLSGGIASLALSGAALFVAGDLNSAGHPPALASVDATTCAANAWDPEPSSYVSAVAVDGGHAYVGGGFVAAGPDLAAVGGIAKLTSSGDLVTSWAPSPTAVAAPPFGPASVGALVGSGTTLYVAGSFSAIGGQTRNGLAALETSTGNATSWNPSPNGPVSSLALSGPTLYAGGGFTAIGGQTRKLVAGLDVSTGVATGWTPPDITSTALYIGVCCYGPNVSAVAVSGSSVYIGGAFTAVGGQSRTGIASLSATSGNLTSWNPVLVKGGITPTPVVGSIAFLGSNVYIGAADVSGSGDGFTSVGGQPRNGLAAVDGTTGVPSDWDPAPDVAGTRVLGIDGSTVYVGGGYFRSIGGQARRGLAALDATTGAATSFAPEIDGAVTSAAFAGGKLLVGGAFRTVDGRVTGPFAAINLPGGTPSDTIPPAITVTTPSEGQHLAQGAAAASAFSCGDEIGGSGVATCAAPASVDTGSAGAKTFTVTATDQAGNAATKVVNYVVDATPPGGGGGDPTPTTGTTPTTPVQPPTPSGPTTAKASAKVAATATKSALLKGLPLVVTGAKAKTQIVARVKQGAKLLGTFKAKASSGGTATIRLKLPSKVAKRLKAKAKLTVSTAFVGGDGKRKVISGTVRVK